MILVTLGTQNLEFSRLLEAVQGAIDQGYIKDRVVVQKGITNFESKDMELFEFIPMEELDHLIQQCELLITHGGVGSIMTGLKYGKKIIAGPRLSQYKESGNDHQLDIIKNFSETGYIIPLLEFEHLDKALELAEIFEPKSYESNTQNMIQHLKGFIEHA